MNFSRKAEKEWSRMNKLSARKWSKGKDVDVSQRKRTISLGELHLSHNPQYLAIIKREKTKYEGFDRVWRMKWLASWKRWNSGSRPFSWFRKYEQFFFRISERHSMSLKFYAVLCWTNVEIPIPFETFCVFWRGRNEIHCRGWLKLRQERPKSCQNTCISFLASALLCWSVVSFYENNKADWSMVLSPKSWLFHASHVSMSFFR